MNIRLVLATVLALLMLTSSVSLADLSSADEADEDATFNDVIPEHILGGIDAVSDAVSKRTDNLLLPSGAASVLEGVVNDDTSEPQTAAVTTPQTYHADETIDELRLAEGASISIDDGTTVRVVRLYIESAGAEIHFSTGTGSMIIESLVVEGLVLPLTYITVSADNASISSQYQRNGQDRSFSMTISYVNNVVVTIGSNTIIYRSYDPAEIAISVDIDLTDYISHVGGPGTSSTIERLFRYIGSLDLVRLDVDINVGGSYEVVDFITPFSIDGLNLAVKSHKDSAVPYYEIMIGLGSVLTYPVEITNISITMDLPASRMNDGSRPTMDRAREFSLAADSIVVKRTEPDDPLDVSVAGLSIGIIAETEPKVTMVMDEMQYSEILMNDKGTFEVGTSVTGFDLDFKGIGSELLDDAKGLIQKIISGSAVEGGFTLGGIHYSRYDVDKAILAEDVEINNLDLKAKLVIPMFNLHFDLESFHYVDATRDISCASVGYDLWIGIDTSFNPEGATDLKTLLKLFTIKSVLQITADTTPDYHFNIDNGRAFLTKFSTEGLRVICGDDTVTLDQATVKGLTSEGDVQISYHRLTADQIGEKVPGKVRERLNGGAVVELSNSKNIKNLEGSVSISIGTDLEADGAGAYYIDTDKSDLIKKECTVENGKATFSTETMGLQAVSGPLKQPDRTVLAYGLLIGAMVLGVAAVFIGRRLLTRGV